MGCMAEAAGIKHLGSVASCNYWVAALWVSTGRGVLNSTPYFIGVDSNVPRIQDAGHSMGLVLRLEAHLAQGTSRAPAVQQVSELWRWDWW
jgi:hypothetical protein